MTEVSAAVNSPAEARSRLLSAPSESRARAGFSILTPDRTGIFFTNHLSLAAVARNRLIEDGSGVAAGDMDGDGLCDLYFCALAGRNRLFRNLGGFRFIDVTDAAGVGCDGQASTGAVFADLDGDGRLDLLVNGLGAGTRLFLNRGGGRFEEEREAGFERRTGARSFAIGDADGDGKLDVYVTHYRRETARDQNETIHITKRGGVPSVAPHLRERFVPELLESGGVKLLELGEPDALYRNLGGGKFQALSWTAGSFVDETNQPLTEPPRDWGLSAMFRDMNGDGAPDLYVCNDFHSPDRIWINKGAGQFRAMPSIAVRKTSWASMAVDFADINRDGRDDFFVGEMLGMTRSRRQTQRDNLEEALAPRLGWGWRAKDITTVTRVMRNTLFLNADSEHYVEMAQAAGVESSDWTWGAVFLDVDLDGYEDLLIANGHARDHLNSDTQRRLALAGPPKNAADRERLFGQIPHLRTPNRAFRNRGDGAFEDRSEAWGFDWTGVSNGMALADLDGDGDLDAVLNNLDAEALVLRNEAAAPRAAIRLRGRGLNTGGVGARIIVRGGPVEQSQEVIAGGRYLSGDDGLRSFAAAPGGRLEVEVIWRSGRRTQSGPLAPGFLHEIREPEEPEEAGAGAGAELVSGGTSGTRPGGTQEERRRPFFEDRSDLLKWDHAAEEFAEEDRQPLLPRRLDYNGCGISWVDVDSDGFDDLAAPGGRGGRMRLWLNDGKGKLLPMQTPGLSQAAPGELTSVLGWLAGRRSAVLIAGSSGYKLSTNLAVSARGYSISLSGVKTIAELEASSNSGPLAAADVDGDGHLDLFVGGQCEPGRYPRAARSVLFRQAGGRFAEDVENTRRLGGAGLVNGAVWTDLDGDGDPDLVLSCEWGPVRVFRNDRGQLTDATVEWGLADFRGWWNGVASGDFNGDGRMDLVAGNWGRNTKYQSVLADELRLYHGDLDGDGRWDAIEAHFDRGLGKEVPGSDFRRMSRVFPFLLEAAGTYEAYARASVQELFGEALSRAEVLRANTLDSMVFVNTGAGFEARSLPLLAQLTPAFGCVVSDFDGDGREDIFLSQNSFAADAETGRYDGGRGLWLRGDGAGGFSAAPSTVSGVMAHGEQRGAAVGDFDQDGRPDLAVMQRAGPLKLYRNREGRPGLRVLLAGRGSNLSGVGAQVRLRFESGLGPAREVQAGSGYWSQNSTALVMAAPAPPTHAWVRWPGGITRETVLPLGAEAVAINPDGQLAVLK